MMAIYQVVDEGHCAVWSLQASARHAAPTVPFCWEISSGRLICSHFPISQFG